MINKSKLLFIFLFFFINQNFVFAQDKVMFIDVDYIFAKSFVGKDIVTQINNKAKSLENDKKKYKTDIDTEKNDILSKKSVLSEKEFNEKIAKLENKIKDINKNISNKSKNFLDFKKKAELEFTKKLTETLQEYVKTNQVDMVINKKNILIGKSEFDTTADVLNLLDNKIKKIKIK